MEYDCDNYLFNFKIEYFFKIIYFQPVTMKDWEIQFQFKNHGSGKDLFGDGFAMWYTKDRNTLGI